MSSVNTSSIQGSIPARPSHSLSSATSDPAVTHSAPELPSDSNAIAVKSPAASPYAISPEMMGKIKAATETANFGELFAKFTPAGDSHALLPAQQATVDKYVQATSTVLATEKVLANAEAEFKPALESRDPARIDQATTNVENASAQVKHAQYNLTEAASAMNNAVPPDQRIKALASQVKAAPAGDPAALSADQQAMVDRCVKATSALTAAKAGITSADAKLKEAFKSGDPAKIDTATDAFNAISKQFTQAKRELGKAVGAMNALPPAQQERIEPLLNQLRALSREALN